MMGRAIFIAASFVWDGAASQLPSPLRGGVGGGGPRIQFVVWYPPPQPSPARGEGAHFRCGCSATSSGDVSRYSAFTYFAGCGAGVGLVPKSTFGAVEISFSFSTVKFGFSL